MNEAAHPSSKTSKLKNEVEQKPKEEKNFIKDSDFCKCWISIGSFLKNKAKYYHSNCSTLNQFIFYLIPIACILAMALVIIHIYLYDSIFKFNYYTLIKEEVLRYLITDIDDAHFELNINEVNNQFEDMANIMFFKLYFGELISLGLLEGEKIFPDLSDVSEEFYKQIDMSLAMEGAGSIFSIPSELVKKYIDNREDSLSELAKVYFYFYPLISFEAYSLQTFINQSFLIAYELDNNSPNISGEELYFNFPRAIDDFFENNNFHAYNNFVAPKINKSRSEPTEKINDSYYFENWFINQDYDFRVRASEIFDLNMNFFHLNSNHEGNLNKTNILSMQTFYENLKGKKIIINIIYFISQKKLRIDSFDHSIFIVANYSNFGIRDKFSDNQTFVISQNDITEITLSSLISEYFHYGLISNNYNFYSKGLFYDNININYLSNPNKYYSTIKGFNFDIRYFSPFYLYSKLMQKSNYLKNYSDEEYIYIYYFNDSWQIKEACSQINFSLHKNYLSSNNIDCYNKKNLRYYSKVFEHSWIAEDITLPNCICLPLYCIKNLNKDFDPNNIEYADDITFPEKCQNKLKYYKNEIEESNIKKNDDDIDTSNIKLREGEYLEEQLEDQFIKFSYQKFNLIGGLSFILISIVDNTSLKILLTNLVIKLNHIRTVFIIIYTVGIILSIIAICASIMINLYRISKIIYQYKLKLKDFMTQLESKIETASKKKEDSNNDNDNTVFNDKNNIENLPLLKNELIEDKIINKFNYINEENTLLEDLFHIYCDYYRKKEETFIENNEGNLEKNKTKKKIKALLDNNELFKLFCLITLYIPKFKLEINYDYNFYEDSKLIKNFIMCSSKKSSNINKDQILYSKSILYELLSTEQVNDDYGFITNLNFNYITNINLDSKKNNNSIQKSIFKQVEDLDKNQKEKEKFYTEDKENKNIKLVFKNKNLIMKYIEEKFEQDDYLQLNKLESAFNSSLINTFYYYSNKIINSKDND